MHAVTMEYRTWALMSLRDRDAYLTTNSLEFARYVTDGAATSVPSKVEFAPKNRGTERAPIEVTEVKRALGFGFSADLD